MKNEKEFPKNKYYKCHKKEKILKHGITAVGYYVVVLTKNKKARSFYVHRLLAITFIPNHQNKKQVNHKNGIKTDNRITNLEWCTAKENINHAWNSGLCCNGNKNHGRVTEAVKRSVFSLKETMTQKQISEIVNLHPSHISRIINNKLDRSKKQSLC